MWQTRWASSFLANLKSGNHERWDHNLRHPQTSKLATLIRHKDGMPVETATYCPFARTTTRTVRKTTRRSVQNDMSPK